MHHLGIKHLRMVCAINAVGNMTRAAEKLYISQSALSQQLKDIEGRLQVDLFFRTRKKMILTPAGKKLLQTAQHVIEKIDDTELEIAKMVSGHHGELKVGTQCIFCYKWLPRVMRAFQHRFPNIEFELGTSSDPAAELHAKTYDVIITAVPAKDDNYTWVPLFEDQMVCIMPKDHPLSVRGYVRFEDFNGWNLISHAEKDPSKFYQLVMAPKGLEPRRFMTVGQPQAMIEMVASGFGISIVPMWAVRSALERYDIAARPITRSGFPLTWRAMLLKKRHMPVFQQEFIQIIRRMNLKEPFADGRGDLVGIDTAKPFEHQEI